MEAVPRSASLRPNCSRTTWGNPHRSGQPGRTGRHEGGAGNHLGIHDPAPGGARDKIPADGDAPDAEWTRSVGAPHGRI